MQYNLISELKISKYCIASKFKPAQQKKVNANSNDVIMMAQYRVTLMYHTDALDNPIFTYSRLSKR